MKKQADDQVIVKTISELDPNKHYMVECRVNTKGISREALMTALKSLRNRFKESGISNVVFVPVGSSEILESISIKELPNN